MIKRKPGTRSTSVQLRPLLEGTVRHSFLLKPGDGHHWALCSFNAVDGARVVEQDIEFSLLVDLKALHARATAATYHKNGMAKLGPFKIMAKARRSWERPDLIEGLKVQEGKEEQDNG